MKNKFRIGYIKLGIISKISIIIGLIFSVFALGLGAYIYWLTGLFGVILVPIIFLLIVIFLAIFVLKRNEIISRYPYLISLPSFVYGLKKEVASNVMSIVFDAYSIIIAFSGILSIVATMEEYYFNIGLIISNLILIILLVVFVALQYYRAYRKSQSNK